MIGQQPSFYSPLSLKSISQEESPALLLQFIIRELLSGDYLIFTPDTDVAPFSWADKPGSRNKIEEFALLLKPAFPHLTEEANRFLAALDSPCSDILLLLEPFIWECRSNENLLLFLIRHQKALSIKSILDKICPEGLPTLKKTVVRQFKKRGFQISRWSR